MFGFIFIFKFQLNKYVIKTSPFCHFKACGFKMTASSQYKNYRQAERTARHRVGFNYFIIHPAEVPALQSNFQAQIFRQGKGMKNIHTMIKIRRHKIGFYILRQEITSADGCKSVSHTAPRRFYHAEKAAAVTRGILDLMPVILCFRLAEIHGILKRIGASRAQADLANAVIG